MASQAESISTASDPRSKRPVKKRALTPVSDQARQLTALFAKPDKEVRIPPSATPRQRDLPPPPDIVTNVQGSSAGAGSGEFHVYKAARRREYERMRRMDEEVRTEQAAEDFDRRRKELDAKDDEKTRRNREKRERAKARKAKARAGNAASNATNPTATGGERRERVPRIVIDNGKNTALGSADDESDGAEPAVEQTGLVIHDDD